MTKEFLVVFEVGPNNFSAFAPDIPGCFALGATIELTRERYLEAANAHLEWMASDRDPMPEPLTTAYDFARSEESETGHYVVEMLAIPIATAKSQTLTKAAIKERTNEKLLTLSLALIFCLASSIDAQNHKYPSSRPEPVRNGLWWENKSSTFKEGFVSGFKLASVRTPGHAGDINKFPSSELLTGLDKFWGDFRNRSILFDDAITYVEDQLSGVADEKLNAELLKMRAAAAATVDEP